jgi:hypothetical protein
MCTNTRLVALLLSVCFGQLALDRWYMNDIKGACLKLLPLIGAISSVIYIKKNNMTTISGNILVLFLFISCVIGMYDVCRLCLEQLNNSTTTYMNIHLVIAKSNQNRVIYLLPVLCLVHHVTITRMIILYTCNDTSYC